VFCLATGDRLILLLGAYEKGKNPGRRRQDREIKVARSRLTEYLRSHRGVSSLLPRLDTVITRSRSGRRMSTGAGSRDCEEAHDGEDEDDCAFRRRRTPFPLQAEHRFRSSRTPSERSDAFALLMLT